MTKHAHDTTRIIFLTAAGAAYPRVLPPLERLLGVAATRGLTVEHKRVHGNRREFVLDGYSAEQPDLLAELVSTEWCRRGV